MTNNYYQEYKEKLRKGAHERYQNLSEEEKDTRLETDIKIFLKKKRKKNVSIIADVIRIFLRSKSKSKLGI